MQADSQIQWGVWTASVVQKDPILQHLDNLCVLLVRLDVLRAARPYLIAVIVSLAGSETLPGSPVAMIALQVRMQITAAVRSACHALREPIVLCSELPFVNNAWLVNSLQFLAKRSVCHVTQACTRVWRGHQLVSYAKQADSQMTLEVHFAQIAVREPT